MMALLHERCKGEEAEGNLLNCIDCPIELYPVGEKNNGKVADQRLQREWINKED